MIKANILDIETTGLAATDEIVCIVYNNEQFAQSKTKTERDILLLLKNAVLEGSEDGPVVTFFGEPKYGSTQGFDMPMLRTKYLLNGISDKYPFSGKNHIDLLDVARKYFNTKTMQEPNINQLSAAQLTELTIECGLHPMKTMAANTKQIQKEELPPEMIRHFVSKKVEQKAVEKNTLDHVFGLFCEDPIKEDHSGSDVPMLFKKYKETGEMQYMDEIVLHNSFCNEKTKYLFKVMILSGLVNPRNIPITHL